ncbi:MAG: carboxylesterase/lipase family protein [Moraxellaceae bacterium]
MANPQVTTAVGRIEGRAVGPVEVFRGIRYGQPLSGLSRIRAPQPVAPWQGVFDAGRFAPGAPQEALSMMAVGETGDDCLALNVWRPAQRHRRLPVMVWIHGGGFATGASHQPLYDATALARDNDVIVVTLNYRLGILGFGAWSAWPELAGDSNVGLRDQILALRWVQAHIADFGGDPAQVTVFGESAGGMSIACLMASPAARGLFQRAIIQSGSPDHVVTPGEAGRITARFVEAAGGDPRACLEGELDGIVAAQRACFSTTVNRGLHASPLPQFGMTLLPMLGDDILPQHPLEAALQGVGADIPLLTGTTLDEWRFFYMAPQAMGRGEPRPEPDEARLQHEFERVLPGRGAAMLARYRALLPGVGNAELFCAFETDRMFRLPTIRLAEARFAHKAATWHYLFDWPCAWNRRMRSCHVIDIPFVFGITEQPTGQFFTGGGESAARLSAAVRAAWAAFAHGHMPVAPGWPAWPPYEAGQRLTLRIGEQAAVLVDPEAERRQSWEGIL